MKSLLKDFEVDLIELMELAILISIPDLLHIRVIIFSHLLGIQLINIHNKQHEFNIHNKQHEF